MRETRKRQSARQTPASATKRAASQTDDELTRIRTLGACYAWSHDAPALRGSMGGRQSASLATIGVLTSTGRDLQRHHI
jgi:hypothetical protein